MLKTALLVSTSTYFFSALAPKTSTALIRVSCLYSVTPARTPIDRDAPKTSFVPRIKSNAAKENHNQLSFLASLSQLVPPGKLENQGEYCPQIVFRPKGLTSCRTQG